MSYCRFSSMNYGCDLYCYQSDSGYVVHVARKRHNSLIPALDYSQGARTLFASYDAQGVALDASELIPIGLPEDGNTFTIVTVDSLIDTLLYLRDLGYRFPAEMLNVDTYQED